MYLDQPTKSTDFRRLREGVDDDEIRSAMEALAGRYRPAVRKLVVHFAGNRLDADDTTQNFFMVKVIGRDLFATAWENKGNRSFRGLLFTAVRHFVIDELRRQKHDVQAVRPDDDAQGWDRIAATTDGDPHKEFVRTWIQSTLELALMQLKDECKGEQMQLEMFVSRYFTTDPYPKWNEVGAPFNLGGKTARDLTQPCCAKFKKILRRLIATDPGCDSDVQREIRNLIFLLS